MMTASEMAKKRLNAMTSDERKALASKAGKAYWSRLDESGKRAHLDRMLAGRKTKTKVLTDQRKTDIVNS